MPLSYQEEATRPLNVKATTTAPKVSSSNTKRVATIRTNFTSKSPAIGIVCDSVLFYQDIREIGLNFAISFLFNVLGKFESIIFNKL